MARHMSRQLMSYDVAPPLSTTCSPQPGLRQGSSDGRDQVRSKIHLEHWRTKAGQLQPTGSCHFQGLPNVPQWGWGNGQRHFMLA